MKRPPRRDGNRLIPVEAGRRFGRLTTTGRKIRRVTVYWECACECGNITAVTGRNLLSGDTQSCGCMRREMLSLRRRRHGQSLSSLYMVWKGMMARCTIPRATGYANYGGRGIAVCERWRRFENFLADMGPRPPGTSLDRIDVNGNYEPTNCRWATREVQAGNARHVRTFLNGQSVSAFARGIDVSHEWLAEMLRRTGLAGQAWEVADSGPGEVLEIKGRQLHFMAAGSRVA
jgi:hypothetical protein